MHEHAAKVWLVLALGALSLCAQAAVYRCERDGQVTYTDRPCTGGDKPHELPPVGVLPGGASEAADLAKQHDARLAAEAKSRDRADQAWLDEHEAQKAQVAEFDKAVRQKRVLKGMSADHVRRALGSPDEVERYDEGEQWFYGTGKSRTAVSFENGQVIATGRGARR